MDKREKVLLLKAGEAFQALEKLIALGVLVLDSQKYECKVDGDLWTIWATSENPTQLDHVCRNIMMYCDAEVSRLENGQTTGASKSDVIFHALDKENQYYLGRFSRKDGLILPE